MQEDANSTAAELLARAADDYRQAQPTRDSQSHRTPGAGR
jgi:hypothetical protein